MLMRSKLHSNWVVESLKPPDDIYTFMQDFSGSLLLPSCTFFIDFSINIAIFSYKKEILKEGDTDRLFFLSFFLY